MKKKKKNNSSSNNSSNDSSNNSSNDSSNKKNELQQYDFSSVSLLSDLRQPRTDRDVQKGKGGERSERAAGREGKAKKKHRRRASARPSKNSACEISLIQFFL